MLSPCGLKPLLKMTSVSLGGLVRSGKVTDLDQNFDPLPQEDFRKVREPMNYRVDASYTYKKNSGQEDYCFSVQGYTTS